MISTCTNTWQIRSHVHSSRDAVCRIMCHIRSWIILRVITWDSPIFLQMPHKSRDFYWTDSTDSHDGGCILQNSLCLQLLLPFQPNYYSDVIMSMLASQSTSLTSVYSNVYSGADQRKHQSSASLAYVRGIYRWPVDSPHKGTLTRKMFPYDDVIMIMPTSLF